MTGVRALAVALAAAALALPAHYARAQDSTREGVVVTHHSVTVGGRTFRYTARAGRLPIRVNETGEVHGWIFFVAYTADRAPGALPRPLTFLWNGGPGANSELVHLVAFGPRRLIAPDTAHPDRVEVRDNPDTWLDATDLVFVDPVGTGYSRLTRGEYAGEFWSTTGDIASVAEFIRVYLTRFDAWRAPLYVGGESYGAWRAAGVTETLERRGIRVAGAILISGGFPMLATTPYELRTALFVPTRTAAALYHGRLGRDLQADPSDAIVNATAWALRTYAPALSRAESLTTVERSAIVAQLSYYTGIEAARIDRTTLVIRRSDFAKELLADRGLVLGRFDARQTFAASSGVTYASDAARDSRTVRYLREELGYRSDLAYVGSEAGYVPAVVPRAGGPDERWTWDQNPPPPMDSAQSAAAAAAAALRQSRRTAEEGPPNGAEPWLRRAMAIDPHLRAFVAIGVYDTLNSCAWNEWILMSLEPPLRANVTTACYVGGHMMYEDADARRRLRTDVAAFIRRAPVPPAR